MNTVRGIGGGGCSCPNPATCEHRDSGAFSMKGEGRRAQKAKTENAKGAKKENKSRKHR